MSARGVLESSLKQVTLEDFNTSALKRLKAGLEAAGNTFEHTIPEKVGFARAGAIRKRYSTTGNNGNIM